MACVLQIGAGGVGGVVAHKMAMNRESFSRIILASRTLDKCRAIADSIREKGLGEIEIDSVNADSVESVVALIEKYRPKLVVNVALPYQDLSIMEACLRTKTHYLDTANYEHPDSAHFEYKEQWAYDTRYKQAGIFALLGSGFDPGVTNVFCAYAQKHYFDEIHSIDILDCNAGDHGYAFATNFNPEINLREVSSKARYWTKDIDSTKVDSSHCETSVRSRGNPQDTESKSLVSSTDLALNPDLKQDTIYRKFEREEKHFTLDSNTQDLKVESYFNGQWRDIAPLALMKEWDYPEVGVKNSYLLYHEELESLIRNIKGLRQIRFFMTFGESYLTHMKCLENIGFLRIDEVSHKGGKIVPIEVLKTLLPDPASLASRTKGQTHIGCYMKGVKDGKERTIYIYNICDHETCYKEVNAQGVSYTTGVPAMIGAKLICEDKWGLNVPKGHSACTAILAESAKIAQSLTSSKLNRDFLDNPQTNSTILECQDSSNMESQKVDSAPCHTERSEVSSLESYNAERLKLNSDMPKGGEYQGIDNATSLAEQNGDENLAAAVEMRNCGFQGGGEGSYLSGSARASNAESAIYRSNATQGAGVWNMEQNDPDPFMCELNKQGLPYVVCEIESNGNLKVLEDGRKHHG